MEPLAPPATSNLPYASLWQRLGALLLDWLILVFLVGIPGLYIAVLLAGALYFVLFPWIAFPISSLYFIVGNGRGGTWGKRIIGLRVRDVNRSGQIGLGRGLVRYLLWLVGLYCLYLGWLWMIWDDRKQTWHDKAAGSAVVQWSQSH